MYVARNFTLHKESDFSHTEVSVNDEFGFIWGTP
jgi:hypothetical protein